MNDKSPLFPKASTMSEPARTLQRTLDATDHSIVTLDTKRHLDLTHIIPSSSEIIRAARRATPTVRRTLQAVTMTLAAEHALRAVSGLALAMVDRTRVPLSRAPLDPPATQVLASHRPRTVVTEITIVERGVHL